MATLHQLRCFLATVEHGSFTGAAAALGLSQPSLSEQIRFLERGLSTALFQRVGRGVVPTEAARALEPHARQAVDAVDQGRRVVGAVSGAVTGTIRFGLFGAAHLYLGSRFVAQVHERFPSARLAFVGQNSMDTIADVRRGHLEAALVALPIDDDSLAVRPVLRDEIVYVTAHEDRARRPVTPTDLAAATLVLSEVTWGDDDYTRRQLKRAVQSVGGTLEPMIEVENVETALDVAALGIADAVTTRSILARRAAERSEGHPSAARAAINTATRLYNAPLEPPLYDHFAIVHRRNASLSPPIRAVIEIATDVMRSSISDEGG